MSQPTISGLFSGISKPKSEEIFPLSMPIGNLNRFVSPSFLLKSSGLLKEQTDWVPLVEEGYSKATHKRGVSSFGSMTVVANRHLKIFVLQCILVFAEEIQILGHLPHKFRHPRGCSRQYAPHVSPRSTFATQCAGSFSRKQDICESPPHPVCFLRSNRILQTYTAQILIVVNPFKKIYQSLYSNEAMMKYRNKPIGTMEPHVFAIADRAYRSMVVGQFSTIFSPFL